MSDWRLVKSEQGKLHLCLPEEGTDLETLLTEHVSESFSGDFPVIYAWEDVMASWPMVQFQEQLREACPDLAEKLDADLKVEREKFEKALAAGTVRYKNLSLYFDLLIESKEPVIRDLYGVPCLLQVVGYEYVGGTRPSFVLECNIQAYVGDREAVSVSVESRIPQYSGTCLVGDLPIRKATPEETERGLALAQKAIEITDKLQAYKGQGSLVIPGIWQDTYQALQGSEVIPDPFGAAIEGSLAESDLHFILSEKVSLFDEDIKFVMPLMSCFSLRYKQWGYCRVNELIPVEYQGDLFEKDLVIPDRTRDLLSAACHLDVKGDMPIEGKGEGAIILLSGPPGCGKTFTAETISQRMQTPLYKLDMGELSVTDPSSMERQLRRILNRASRWNATLLFDEADVFLAPRGHDVMHKAMVTTFLRKLEYYCGILILTTNLLELDPAVMQRALVSIQYPALQEEGRARIWERNMQRFGMSADMARTAGLECARKHPDLNGRDVIKSLVLAARLSDLQNKDLLQSLQEVLSDSPVGA